MGLVNIEDEGKTDGVNVFEFKELGEILCEILLEILLWCYMVFVDKDVQELINVAVEARKRAYNPYSGKWMIDLTR